MIFTKKEILRMFEDPRSPNFSIVNDILAAATIISILAIILETVPSLEAYHGIFVAIEWITVILFTLEYGARLYATPRTRTYAGSFFGIVDLLAILPTYLGLGNFTFLKSARIVRIMRFLRLVRISKLAHVDSKDAEETLGILGFNIALYACALLLAMLGLGVALHLLASTGDTYWSIPQGMYWTFSVFLGGLPAPIPPGTAGTIIFIIAKFIAMALFGLLIGVVGKIFNDWILGKRK